MIVTCKGPKPTFRSGDIIESLGIVIIAVPPPVSAQGHIQYQYCTPFLHPGLSYIYTTFGQVQYPAHT